MAAAAFVAAGAFLASMALLTAYERTKSVWLGWAESYAFLILYLALGALVLGLHGDFVDAAPVLVWASTTVGALGVLGCLAGQTATLFCGVPFPRVAVLITVAFAGILLWMGGISGAVLAEGVLPAGLGWLGVGVVAVAVLIIAVMLRDPALVRGIAFPLRPRWRWRRFTSSPSPPGWCGLGPSCRGSKGRAAGPGRDSGAQVLDALALPSPGPHHPSPPHRARRHSDCRMSSQSRIWNSPSFPGARRIRTNTISMFVPGTP